MPPPPRELTPEDNRRAQQNNQEAVAKAIPPTTDAERAYLHPTDVDEADAGFDDPLSSFPSWGTTPQDMELWDKISYKTISGQAPKSKMPEREVVKNKSGYYHNETRLTNGHPALLVDPGSRGNLAGDKWFEKWLRIACSTILNLYRTSEINH